MSSFKKKEIFSVFKGLISHTKPRSRFGLNVFLHAITGKDKAL